MLCFGDVTTDPTDLNDIVVYAVAGDALNCIHCLFADTPCQIEQRIKSKLVCCNTRPEQVGLDTLELCNDRSDIIRPFRNSDVCDLFHRPGKCK